MDEEMMRVALAAIEQELRVEPANGNLWLERGRLHRALGNAQEAMESLRRAMELDPAIAARITGGFTS